MHWLEVLRCDESLPKLNMFGVSVKDLGLYVTTDKDVIRRRSRMPTADFLINNQDRQSERDKDPQEEDFEDDTFDDFVFIDKAEL